MSAQSIIIDVVRSRFPFCIVWTPIPLLTWLFPFIGHMGIALSSGVIRDFAAPYYVSEDNMAFGKPTKYWQLQPSFANGGWDSSIIEASEIYKTHVHNLFCDNCHSHVATALNFMQYGGSNSWNMVKLALLMAWHGKYVSFPAYVKTWFPFFAIVIIVVCILIFF
ncbi:transmembrane protein 222 isoform X2 [Sitophilus oryzae]|uniref:Transmembrane protein 222 isoform X2 n=1 Tax=Sitophilus oryzae TaxID=7048 RepID=A0A6J2YP93_SITOR|nr:transmembrane protein 222 isoform X2 [Sitophilus oryzae]